MTNRDDYDEASAAQGKIEEQLLKLQNEGAEEFKGDLQSI